MSPDIVHSPADSESQQTSNPLQAAKARIRFRKAGDLRLVSHHDLMQCFERMFRRARIPFRSTQGFHPKPQMVFALSLALGIVGCEEVIELEFCEPLCMDDVKQRLTEHCLSGLTILSVEGIDRKKKAHPRRVRYEITVPNERIAQTEKRIGEILSAAEWFIARTRPKPRRFDLRPLLHDLLIDDQRLAISLWVTPTGMARAEEVLTELGLTDLVEGGAVIERTKLELADEMNENEAGPQGLPSVATDVPAAEEKSSKPTSLFPGPMSYDS